VLLRNAVDRGVELHQPATVETVALDGGGVTLAGVEGGRAFSVQSRFLVDASGRDGFLARRVGAREPVPNLGKVAVFAHFRGAARGSGRDEGSIRIHVFEDGWFWWIPFSSGITSVGCVMHARTVRSRRGSVDDLFAEMIRRCRRVAEGLAGAERVTDVHTAANFAYVNRPAVGDRFVAVGDAIAFVDPIFSGGVHIAIYSGCLAADAIAPALRDGRFGAARFAAYEDAVWRGVRPFFKFIHKYYEPAFFELFMHPKPYLGVFDAVLSVLAGGAFGGLSWRMRTSLAVMFALARVNVWVRRRAGRPVESRLEW
jgi:flavin-dependent dehydrogenase